MIDVAIRVALGSSIISAGGISAGNNGRTLITTTVQTQVKLQCVLHKLLQLHQEHFILLPFPVGIVTCQRQNHLVLPPVVAVRNDFQLTTLNNLGGVVVVTFFLELVPVAEGPEDVHARVYSTDLVKKAHG